MLQDSMNSIGSDLALLEDRLEDDVWIVLELCGVLGVLLGLAVLA
jgi:hypothetical protein